MFFSGRLTAPGSSHPNGSGYNITLPQPGFGHTYKLMIVGLKSGKRLRHHVYIETLGGEGGMTEIAELCPSLIIFVCHYIFANLGAITW